MGLCGHRPFRRLTGTAEFEQRKNHRDDQGRGDKPCGDIAHAVLGPLKRLAATVLRRLGHMVRDHHHRHVHDKLPFFDRDDARDRERHFPASPDNRSGRPEIDIYARKIAG
jgi:hypothetical protein